MSFLGTPRVGLGFGPSAELMRPTAGSLRNRFIHEAYGPRIDAGTEFVAVVPMDADDNVLSANVLAEGAEGEVSFSYEDLIKILERAGPRAVKFFLAHNHPSGDPAPSDYDLLFTFRVMNNLRKWYDARWQLVDHIITTSDPSRWGYSSLRSIRPAEFEKDEELIQQKRAEAAKRIKMW